MTRTSVTENMVYGTRSVIEAIVAGKEIEKLFIQKNALSNLQKKLIDLCKARHIPYSLVPLQKLNRLTRKNHQGVVAYISPIEFKSLDHIVSQSFEKGKDPFLVVLDSVTDVRNLGAIARTAECAGVNGLVIPGKGSAQINSDAIKTSAGALHRLSVVRSNDLISSLQFLKESGITLVACNEKSRNILYETPLEGPMAVIMGSEDRGIRQSILDMADIQLKIPLPGNIASLNVSVAAGIVIYEVIRQRL